MKKIIKLIKDEGFEGGYAIISCTLFWVLVAVRYLFIPSLSWWVITIPLALPIYLFAIAAGIFLSILIISSPGIIVYCIMKFFD